MNNTYKTLNEVCNSIGVTRRNIQGYEEKGLVSASSKNKYGHLLYDESAQERIKQIKMYRDFGFTLNEIKKLIDAPNPILKATLEQQKLYLESKQAQINMSLQEIDDLINKL